MFLIILFNAVRVYAVKTDFSVSFSEYLALSSCAARVNKSAAFSSSDSYSQLSLGSETSPVFLVQQQDFVVAKHSGFSL